MFRRSFLLAGVAALAGCSSTGSDAGGRTVNPALRATPTASPTPTPEPTAYGAGDADALDRPRSVILSNRLVRSEWVTLRIEANGTGVRSRTVRVPRAGRTTLADVFGAARPYTVSVRTADNRRRTVKWAPGPGGDDLGIDLDGGVSVRDVYPPSAAPAFVEGSTGGLLASTTADGTTLAVDAPGAGGRVRIAASGGGGSAAVDLRVPAGSRVPVPLSVSRGRISVRVETDEGEDRHGWRPFEDGTLYCLLGPTPRLVCDLLVRDLLVENATDDEGPVDVRVRADGERVLDRTVYPAAGATVRLPTAVPPAGSFSVSATRDGEGTRRSFTRCPARGPLVVRLTDGTVEIESRAVDSGR
ncbi:hypothetical protein [Halobaculum magnesiiphilum]|uniref:Ig-like domain-containing protein n=1 Tax=Halobaculum magnesiiphilum TaxID=1017351 RepID=A0A8T8WGB4_9EURY|nr:hypothetical protein [Halobaculum magnesiiphilum]QZP38793.1 hypothetical protein K6T50_06555 [Halobaculum magnesiiphilum]